MTTSTRLNVYNDAKEPPRALLVQLGWAYVLCQTMAMEHGDALPTGQVRVGGRRNS